VQSDENLTGNKKGLIQKGCKPSGTLAFTMIKAAAATADTTGLVRFFAANSEKRNKLYSQQTN